MSLAFLFIPKMSNNSSEARAAHARLKAVAAQYEQLIGEADDSTIRSAGRQYAADVHEYALAAMQWLSWIDKELSSGLSVPVVPERETIATLKSHFR